MGDFAAHWWRLGQLTISEALRESGLSDVRIDSFSRNLQKLESLREIKVKHVEEFCNRCRDYEECSLPATEENKIDEPVRGSLEHVSSSADSLYARQRVVNYWKCLLLATIGRGTRPSKLTSISLIRDATEISLDEDEAAALCVNLSSNAKVQALHLRNQPVFGTKQVCDLLSRALKTNSALKELTLSCVDMSCAAVKILLIGLEKNTTLEALDLGTNGEMGNEGTAYVAQMLTTSTSLKRLDLQGVGCGFESAKLMSSALGCNATLEAFSFGNNPISAEGMKVLLALFTPKESSGSTSWNTLATALKTGGSPDPKNTTIKHLGFQYMKPLDVSVEFFASMIKTNKTLVSLDLSGLSLEPHDWVDNIIPALKVNDTLQRLVLDKSGDLPCEAFMELITSTSTKTALEEINLEGTNMASKAGAIHEELLINKRYRKRWRDQIRVKPRSARIVLCGFEFAGKSTICKTMRDGIHGTTCIDTWKLALKRMKRIIRKVPCIGEMLFGKQDFRDLAERTRGCEIVHLRDYDKQGRISVWDFTGLKKYYALHDYLFPSFKNSCFLYVCSVRFPPYIDGQTVGSRFRRPRSIKSREDIREEFLYWLRFIASNSKPIPDADGQCGPRPRVALVLTNKDTLDSINLQMSTNWARDVVYEMRDRFKDVVDLQEEVEVVDAHSREDVQRLFNVAEDSLEQLLELSTEYAVCEEVRLALEDRSARKSKPVLNMTDFKKLCDKRLQTKMDPIEYRAARLGTPEGQVDVLTYLDYTGEIIYTDSLDLIVVNPRWFGMGVLGSLIDLFGGLGDHNRRGLIGSLEDCLYPWGKPRRFHHTHGFVREEDFKEITKHLERHIDPEALVELMVQLELCFKVEVDVKETEDDADTQGSASVSLRTPLLGFRGKRTGGDVKPNLLFIPSLFDDEKAPEGMRKLEWNPVLDNSNQHFQYIGRRLECENKFLTFLTPGFFPRLQVYLLNDIRSKGWTDNKGFRMDRNLIGFFEDGMEVLVEYNGYGDYFVDILVKSSQSFSETSQFIEVHLVSRIKEFCATPRGCQGVLLVEAVVRPVCVKYLLPCEERENQAELISLLEDRIKENGRGYQYAWREDIEGFSDLDFALDLLRGEGYLGRMMRREILDAVNRAISSVTRGSSGWPSGLEKEQEAVIFPGLFYPALENAAVVLKILANIDTEIPINIHFLCEDRDGAHVVEDQAGRILQVKANSNSPILKYALSLIWFGVIRGATNAGLSADSTDESWIERLFNASDVSTCIEDLFRIMDPGKPLRAAPVHDILDAYLRYLQIEPSTDWLLEFLFLDNKRDFWQDFQLWKVRYTDSNQTAWVCDQHYQEGTKWGNSMFHSGVI